MEMIPIMLNGTRPEAGSAKDCRELLARHWRSLFVFHNEALSSTARILTEGPCSPAVVLFNAEKKIADRDIPQEFRYRYAVRSVVLAALIMPSLEHCPDGFELFDSGSAELTKLEDRMAALPRRERCVVFLRDVLGYSRRETGLLMGIGDSQVDDSLYSGRNRLLLQGGVAFEEVKPYFDTHGSLAQHTKRGALPSCA
jgi:hypothetical protein